MPIERRKPRLIPVLDVMNGQVVRAVGGRRHEYRPLTSKLVQSTDPQTVAEALLNATGAKELYIADLDALGGFQTLTFQGFTPLGTPSIAIWFDGGFGPRHDIRDLPDLPFLHPVVGFETCSSPEYLRGFLVSNADSSVGNVPSCRVGRGFASPTNAINTENGGARKASTHPTKRNIGFSIDLREGELIGNWRAWGLRNERDALGLARKVVRMGCQHLIVLDLARVGTGTGCGTDELLRAIRAEFPQIELIAGGGVKTWEDIDQLGECGADAVLVASALHDGRITVPQPVSPALRP